MIAKGFLHPDCLLLSAAIICFVADMVSGFERNCQTNEKGDISCSFIVRESWNFLEFRDWLDHYAGDIGNVSLNLTCLDGGKVFLPHPFRARNLQKISVTACVLDGFYSEFSPEPAYPDSLKESFLEDVVVLADIHTLLDIAIHPGFKSFICGHETIVRQTLRNMSYSFLPTSSPPPIDTFLEAGDILDNNRKNQAFVCNYKNFLEKESSKQTHVSKQSFDAMVENSLYPRLYSFIYSSNSIVTFPPKMAQWWKYFPALRTLDLSNNQLSNFSFEHPDVNQDCVYINLANNNISSVPVDFLTYLTGRTPLFVNLLDNPIHCDCSIYPLFQYLKALLLDPKYSNLTKVKCHSPTVLAGIEVLSLSFETCSGYL